MATVPQGLWAPEGMAATSTSWSPEPPAPPNVQPTLVPFADRLCPVSAGAGGRGRWAGREGLVSPHSAAPGRAIGAFPGEGPQPLERQTGLPGGSPRVCLPDAAPCLAGPLLTWLNWQRPHFQIKSCSKVLRRVLGGGAGDIFPPTGTDDQKLTRKHDRPPAAVSSQSSRTTHSLVHTW